jgi:predicted secreted hydrolase
MSRIVLPAADAVQPKEPVQWWYWTGHLDDGARRFGFEACFFAMDAESVLGQRLRTILETHSGFLERFGTDLLSHLGFQMANIALTNLAAGSYDSHVLMAPGVATVIPDRYAFHLSFPHGHSAAAAGGGGRDTIQLDGGTWRLDLELSNDDAAHPPALHYDGERHDYTFGGYTYYYSRPSQAARGQLILDGRPCDVTGRAWFDRQYGDLYEASRQGWQWFAIQLNDDSQIMLFEFDRTGGVAETRGAIMQGGRYTRLGPGDFTVEVLRRWTSPSSGIDYPAQWRLVIGDRRLIVTPTSADQEVRELHPFPTYWEGDCLVAHEGSGDAGQAYVELQGFTRVAP